MLKKIKYFVRSIFIPNSILLINKTKKDRRLYLTFDDGPHPQVTPELLSLLKEHDVKATFFIIGKHAKQNPDLLISIINAGHKIANHTYTHPSFEKVSLQKKMSEIIKTNNLIEEFTGQKCAMFRAPRGNWSFKLLIKLARLKITAIHWSRDSMDYLKEPPEKIIERFYKNPVEPGDILLFHDDNEICINSLKILIPHWKSEGYTLEGLEL